MKKIALIFLTLLPLIKVTAQTPKTDAALNTQGNTIKNETNPNANTPIRVGTWMLDENASKVNNNQYSGVTATGTDTYAACPTTAIVSYPAFYSIKVTFTNANTGPATLSLCGLAAKNIKKISSVALVSLAANDLCAGCSYWLMYNGTDFQILGGGSSGGGGGSGVWGAITGTLTDQTDLKAAMDLKQPYLKPTSVKTATYNAVDKDFVPVDATGATVQINLPTSPAESTIIGVKMIATGSSNLTQVVVGGSDKFNVAGGATTFSLTAKDQTAYFQFHCTTSILGVCSNGLWYSTSQNTLTNSAVINEVPKIDGTLNLVTSGLYSSTAGNLDLGSTSLTGDRTISAKSSSASNSLYLQTTNGSSAATNALQLFISGTKTVIVAPPGNLSLSGSFYGGRSLIGSASGFDFTNYPAGLSEVVATNNSSPNTVLLPFRIAATASSGTPANGFGVGMEFAAQNASSTNIVGSTISSVADDIVAGTEDFSLRFKTITAGTLAEKIRFTSLGEIGLSGANYGTAGQTIVSGGPGAAVTWGAGGGSGTVSTVSVVSANGLAGTVANPTTTPAITLSTTVNGLVKGNGTAFSAASAGTDYEAAGLDWRLTGASTLTGNVTINQAGFNTTWAGIGTATFSPTSTSAGLNVGSYAGVPGTFNNGDFNYNTLTKTIQTKVGGNVSSIYANARVYNVMDYGAKHDWQTVSDGAMTSGNATLTSATGLFTAADVGKKIYVVGAGAAGVDLTTTVSAYISATQLTLSVTASTTVSSKTVNWSTDDTTFIQAAINAAFTAGGGMVYFPNGIYGIWGALAGNNCQLYIPYSNITSPNSTLPRITLQGESVRAMYIGMLAAQAQPTTGVVLMSTIIGSGTTPSVIGSVASNGTDVEVININIRTKSMIGGIDSAPTMTAFNFFNLFVVTMRNCFADTESQTINSVAPTSINQVGFYAPAINNAGNISFENCWATGYYVGFLINEHFTANQIWANACFYGLYLAPSNHISKIDRFFSNGCVHAIYFSGRAITNIDQFGFERYPGSPSRWYIGINEISGVSSNGSIGIINYYGLISGGSSVLAINDGNQPGVAMVDTEWQNPNFQGNSATLIGATYKNLNAQGATIINLINSGNGSGQMFKNGSSGITIKNILPSDFAVYNTTGNISVLNDNVGGNINFSAGGGGSSQFTLNSNGTNQSIGKFGVGVAPVSTLDVSGSLGLKSNAISTDLTLDATYYEVLVDASGGNRLETLPAAASSIGRVYVIKKGDSSVNSVTIDGNASETIDGALTKVVNTQYSGWQIHVNAAGTAWNITATF